MASELRVSPAIAGENVARRRATLQVANIHGKSSTCCADQDMSFENSFALSTASFEKGSYLFSMTDIPSNNETLRENNMLSTLTKKKIFLDVDVL